MIYSAVGTFLSLFEKELKAVDVCLLKETLSELNIVSSQINALAYYNSLESYDNWVSGNMPLINLAFSETTSTIIDTLNDVTNPQPRDLNKTVRFTTGLACLIDDIADSITHAHRALLKDVLSELNIITTDVNAMAFQSHLNDVAENGMSSLGSNWAVVNLCLTEATSSVIDALGRSVAAGDQ
jgi:small-conductance mechanosensitive channel